MTVVAHRPTSPLQFRPRRARRLFTFALLALAAPLISAAAEPAATAQVAPPAEEGAENDETISLAAYNVKADRIEDFGLRVRGEPYPLTARRLGVTTIWFAKFAPLITAIMPNTAAAKAGLQPGERILKSDGKSTVGGPFSTGKFGQWHKNQQKKWAEVAAGKTNVTWTLEIETPVTKAVRTVQLVVPTPPPHWGASVWQAPAGRAPSAVAEPGPLAERSRAILDNGIARLLEWPLSSVAGDQVTPGSEPTATGYEWHVDQKHRIVVTQFRGRTHVFFETATPATGRRIYLTSPSGALEKAWRWTRRENIARMKAKTPELAAKAGEVPVGDAEVRAGFEHELDLWTTNVGKFSARWPFEVKPGYDPNAIFATFATRNVAPAASATVARPLAADFLKLPPATEAQRAIFAEACGKLGAEPDRWAYTETSRGLEDKRVIVTRVDPSKPEAGRCVLLSIDGKAPTPAEAQRWRDDGGNLPKPLGDLPPLADLVDLKDMRIHREEPASVVFELPMRGGNADFPAEKFQALFRVNKAYRSFDDITVKLRDSFRVAGVVKITEAGLQARFQTLDPAHPPQPVLLKAGGGVRILLVKLSRDFETTRADFQRVQPYVEPDPAEPAAVPISVPLPGRP